MFPFLAHHKIPLSMSESHSVEGDVQHSNDFIKPNKSTHLSNGFMLSRNLLKISFEFRKRRNDLEKAKNEARSGESIVQDEFMMSDAW